MWETYGVNGKLYEMDLRETQVASTVNPHGSQMADSCKHDTEHSCSLGAESFLTG
jgi:hypothetical protein